MRSPATEGNPATARRRASSRTCSVVMPRAVASSAWSMRGSALESTPVTRTSVTRTRLELRSSA